MLLQYILFFLSACIAIKMKNNSVFSTLVAFLELRS
jgi:hypothetical protein